MIEEELTDDSELDLETVTASLRELLIEAQDSDNPNFAEAQKILQKARKQDPFGFASSLIKEVKDPDAPYNVLFLALVLISHCFQTSIIPISKEHRQLSSSFPSEMILQLFDITFELFLNKHDAIRNTAIHLFSLIAITQIQDIQKLGIDKRLIDMLTGAQSVETILSATECIWNLMLHHTFTPDEQQIIIQTLFQILSIQNDDTQLIDRCIRLLGSFSYLIPRLFDSEEQFIHFIFQIMNFFQCTDLKEAVYQFFDSALIYTPALLDVILDPLLESSVEDLTTLTNQRNILIKIIVLWESLVTKEIITCHPEFITKVIPQILPPLISVMQSVNTTLVLDYTEWEPYTAAYSCIQAFAVAQPDAVLPLLSDYITGASESSSPFDREGAIKSLRITFQVAPLSMLSQMISDSLQLLDMQIGDPAPRVRAAVVDCLIVIINACMHECSSSDESGNGSGNDSGNGSGNDSPINSNGPITPDESETEINLCTWHLFEPFIDPLFELGRDVEPTAKQAFEALRLIAKFDDFDRYPDFFNTIVSTVPNIPNSVLPQVIDCLSLTVHSNVPKDVVFEVFQFLYSFLMHVLNEWRTYSILDMICKVMSTILINADERIEEYAESLCKTMYDCFRELSLSNALTVVASLSFPARDFIQDQIPIFIPLVMEAQRSYKDPGVLIPSIRIVALIVNRLDLGDEIFDQLMDNMFKSLRKGETANAKAEILNVFYILVTKKTEMFLPYITNLYTGMLYLVTYLENVYQIYLECTAQIVANICHLCVALINVVSDEDKHHIFLLGIQLINTVAKMPKLLSQINGDLVDVILCLMRNFRDETKLQIQQIPSISEVMRSGMKSVQAPDAEIEELMAVLMNNVQSS